jgi:hypothetical protein|tara:strand:- start:643 stop:849 length:207 start_codon:yes stop_codon:yes gene_type:complete
LSEIKVIVVIKIHFLVNGSLSFVHFYDLLGVCAFHRLLVIPHSYHSWESEGDTLVFFLPKGGGVHWAQ